MSGFYPLDDRSPLARFPEATRSKQDGSPRRVGLEIEFSGMSLPEAASVLASELDTEARQLNQYAYELDGPGGTFQLEHDIHWLLHLEERRVEGEEIPALESLKAQLLGPLAESVMPLELVAPPLPFEELSVVDELCARLAEAGAGGTKSGLVYAFGVHVNCEAWSMECDAIGRAVRGYGLLQPLLFGMLDIDAARRISPFIDPYPAEYIRVLSEPGYRPSCDRLFDDYLRYNPTRRRALDMLCILAELDAERVYQAVPAERAKIQPRPAYHYRLPNSHLGSPGWKPSDELWSWALVEHLAADDELIEAAATDVRNRLDTGLFIRQPTAAAPWLSELRERVGLTP